MVEPRDRRTKPAKATEPAELGGQLLNIDQVAEHLGVAVQTIYVWRHRKMGPKAIKVGTQLRWRPEDVEAWLEEQAS